MIVVGRLGGKPTEADATVTRQGRARCRYRRRCRRRVGSGSDGRSRRGIIVLLLPDLSVGVAGSTLMVLLVLVLVLVRSKVGLLIDVAWLISKTLCSSKGIDELLGLYGPEAPVEGHVEQTVAGLGQNLVSELV